MGIPPGVPVKAAKSTGPYASYCRADCPGTQRPAHPSRACPGVPAAGLSAMNAVHPPQVDCITESGTPYGYWWRSQHSPGEPEVTLTAVIMIAGEVAIPEARQRAKTHCVARATAGPDA